MKKNLILFTIAFAVVACNNKENLYDASGTFESTEIIVSAQATGQLLQFTPDEGDTLLKDAVAGLIDSTQLHLTRMQLLESQKAILSGRPDTKQQIDATQKQIDNALLEQKRVQNLVNANVASQQQLDEVNTRLAVLQAQLAAQKSTLGNSTSTLNQQSNALYAQLEQVEDQLRKCKITSPVSGTVISKYANEGELAISGKPLFKIADLSEMTLRAYVTGDQLPGLKNGQRVKVMIDEAKGKYRNYDGIINWISSKAEFTPKTIQTKDERANLVYAIKIKVKNDGYIKIGMYGEVKF